MKSSVINVDFRKKKKVTEQLTYKFEGPKSKINENMNSYENSNENYVVTLMQMIFYPLGFQATSQKEDEYDN